MSSLATSLTLNPEPNESKTAKGLCIPFAVFPYFPAIFKKFSIILHRCELS